MGSLTNIETNVNNFLPRGPHTKNPYTRVFSQHLPSYGSERWGFTVNSHFSVFFLVMDDMPRSVISSHLGGGGQGHSKGRLTQGTVEKRKKKRNPCDLELTYNPQKRKWTRSPSSVPRIVDSKTCVSKRFLAHVTSTSTLFCFRFVRRGCVEST